MGYHTFDPGMADRLEDPKLRYRYLSVEELLFLIGPGRGSTVDLGSGTGFYTDDIADFFGTVYAVDVQREMHGIYRGKEAGVPENVEPVTADIEEMPFETDELGSAYSTMTYHEFATEDALEETGRVLRQDAPLVVADWSSEAKGEVGPPTEERYSMDEAVRTIEQAGFGIDRADERTETFVLRAVNR